METLWRLRLLAEMLIGFGWSGNIVGQAAAGKQSREHCLSFVRSSVVEACNL